MELAEDGRQGAMAGIVLLGGVASWAMVAT